MKQLTEMKATEIKEMAKEMKITNWWTKKKADLITEIESVLDVPTQKEKVDAVINKSEVSLNTEEIENIEIEKDEDNIISLKEIFLEAGIKGTKARRLLRNADIERPFKRWEWDKNLHADIIKKVKDLLK